MALTPSSSHTSRQHVSQSTDSANAPAPEASSAAKNVVLIAAALASFLTPFMGSSINIALPPLGEEYAMDAIMLGWVATAYLLAAAVSLVPLGKISDMYGRKRVFTAGILIFSLFSLLTPLAGSAGMLIALRVLQGVGSSMIFATSVAILMSTFPPGERGRALGLTTASVYLGLSLGPFLGGMLTQHLGWRSIFWTSSGLGLIIAGLVFWKLRGEWAEAPKGRFDWGGTALYGGSLIAFMYGLSSLPEIAGGVLVVIGLAGLAGFVVWESRVDNPLLHLDLFRKNPVFAFSNLAALIHYSATAAVAFLLSLYLQYIQGLSPQVAGTILIAQPAVMAVFSPIAGRLSDRIEPRILASAGMAVTVVGLIMLAILGQDSSLGYVIVCLLLLGFGFGLFSSPNANAIMSSVERKYYGIGSALLGTNRLIGQMISMGIAMLIFALMIGRVQITPAYYFRFLSSMQTAFVLFAALCLVGVFASMARGSMRSPAEKPL